MAMPSTARTMRWVCTGLSPEHGPIEDCRRLQVSDIGLPGGSKRGCGGNPLLGGAIHGPVNGRDAVKAYRAAD